MPDDLLTPKDVQARLKLSRTAVYHLLRSGSFPVVEILPGTLRVRTSVLEAYLKQRTVADRTGRPLKIYPPMEDAQET